MAGERGDFLNVPVCSREIGQAQVPGGVRSELRTLARSEIPSTTLDHVHFEIGRPALRRDSDRNRGPRSRLNSRRLPRYAANRSPVAGE